MKAFVGFIWEDIIDKPVQWHYGLTKGELIDIIQKSFFEWGFLNARSQIFNNLSDIKKFRIQVKNKNLLIAINSFLEFAHSDAGTANGYFVDNQPHDK